MIPASLWRHSGRFPLCRQHDRPRHERRRKWPPDCSLSGGFGKISGVPRGVLLVLLYVEAGRPGMVSPNGNGTADLGPMQVNTTWVDRIARRWHSTPAQTYAALRDSSCANIEAGAWILGQAMHEAHGDLWQAVAFYHSHTPRHGNAYLRRFYDIALTMMARNRRDDRS
ncbi:lytic transglycosylase domain-containing protein [Komagataeibacter rhaeticus]|nr:lytic transglycosylase domain-containing protein [Komagataeibacter rhaeticus]